MDSLALFSAIPADTDLGALDHHVPGTARKVELTVIHEGTVHPISLIVLRLADGSLRVYGNRCAHFGIPLDAAPGYAFLSPDGATLRCQHHYADYALCDGRGLSRDCAGESLPAIAVVVRDGRILTT